MTVRAVRLRSTGASWPVILPEDREPRHLIKGDALDQGEHVAAGSQLQHLDRLPREFGKQALAAGFEYLTGWLKSKGKPYDELMFSI